MRRGASPGLDPRSPGGPMAQFRPTSRRPPPAAAAVALGLAALGNGPQQVLGLARGVVRVEPSFRELPAAAAWSLLRMTASYVISVVFAWVMGSWAASSPAAAKILLPLLDVGQSVPVLGFFPAAIYVFIT